MAADDAALAQLTEALQRADAEGFRRGQQMAKAELAGLDPAGLIAGALADAMEQIASRMVQVDAGFASRLTVYAGRLRSLADPPKVVSFDPRGGAEVPSEQNIIQATFDQEMDGAKMQLELHASSGGPALKGDVSWDAASRTVSLRLAKGLTAGVGYRASVDGGTVDGGSMEEPFTWEFVAASE